MRTRRPSGSCRGGGDGGGGSESHLCTRGRCHLHPLLPAPHLRSEGLLELEDFLDVFSLLFPGGAALAVLPGHGRRGRRARRAARLSGQGRAREEGAPGGGGAGAAEARAAARRSRRAGRAARGCSAREPRRLCAAAGLPLLQFPLSLSPPRSLPGSYFCASWAQTSCRRAPGSFAAGCQPHFLLLSCLPSPPSPPPALLPSPLLLPRAPRPLRAPRPPPASPPPARCRLRGCPAPRERRAPGAGAPPSPPGHTPSRRASPGARERAGAGNPGRCGSRGAC